MTAVRLAGDNSSGTGTFNLDTTGTSTSRVITLPDATTTLVGTDVSQTLSNKTFVSPTVSGSPTINATRLRSIGSQSLTGTSVVWTGIPSWTKRVTLSIYAASAVSGTAGFLVYLGTSAGKATSGYASVGSVTDGAGTGITSSGGTFISYTSSGTGSPGPWNYYANYVFYKVTGNTWVLSYAGYHNSNCEKGGGYVNLPGTLDRVYLDNSSGFDNGLANVFYD